MSKETNSKNDRAASKSAASTMVKCKLKKTLEYGDAIIAAGEVVLLPVTKAKALQATGNLEVIGA